MIKGDPLHIVLCVTNDLSQDQRMGKTANSLVEMGHHVTLVGRTINDSLPLIKQSYDQKRLNCWINKGAIFYLEYNIRLFIFLAFGSSYNIITACDLDTILAVILAGKIKKIKTVFDAHEYFIEVPELKGRSVKKKIWEIIERSIVPKMDQCYTVNQSLARIFKNRLNVEFEVVENWPVQSELISCEYKPKNILLYQGVLNEGRGLMELIKIMKHFEDCELWIIGKGVMESNLQMLIQDEALEDQVKLLGFVSPKNLPQITAQASVGINLLVSSSLNYYYSSANKFYDYIHAELPSINMNFPEYQNINNVYHVAVLVDDLMEDTLKSAVEKIVTKKHYQLLKSNCKEAKKHLKWSQNLPTLQTIYSKIKN